jgi:tetratricopeptide (TPR) repeat protein
MLQKVYFELQRVLADVFASGMAQIASYQNRYVGNQPFLSFCKMRHAISKLRSEHSNRGKGNGKTTEAFPSSAAEKLFNSDDHRSCTGIETTPVMAASSHVERQLGNREAILGNWDAAEQRWKRSLHIFGWNASSEHLLGLHCLQSSKLHEAERHFLRSLAMDPDFKATYANLSATYLSLCRYEAAEKVAAQGLKRYPQTAECNYNLGVALAKRLLEDIDAGSHSQRQCIHRRRQHFFNMSQRAIAELGCARDGKLERVETEAKSRWLASDDELIRRLEQLGKVLERDENQDFKTDCEDFHSQKLIGWTICNYRP